MHSTTLAKAAMGKPLYKLVRPKLRQGSTCLIVNTFGYKGAFFDDPPSDVTNVPQTFLKSQHRQTPNYVDSVPNICGIQLCSS